jgi:hypothetical protein
MEYQKSKLVTRGIASRRQEKEEEEDEVQMGASRRCVAEVDNRSEQQL